MNPCLQTLDLPRSDDLLSQTHMTSYIQERTLSLASRLSESHTKAAQRLEPKNRNPYLAKVLRRAASDPVLGQARAHLHEVYRTAPERTGKKNPLSRANVALSLAEFLIPVLYSREKRAFLNGALNALPLHQHKLVLKQLRQRGAKAKAKSGLKTPLDLAFGGLMELLLDRASSLSEQEFFAELSDGLELLQKSLLAGTESNLFLEDLASLPSIAVSSPGLSQAGRRLVRSAFRFGLAELDLGGDKRLLSKAAKLRFLEGKSLRQTAELLRGPLTERGAEVPSLKALESAIRRRLQKALDRARSYLLALSDDELDELFPPDSPLLGDEDATE